MTTDHRPGSDDRADTLDQLGSALATGELDLTEYEQRTAVARATPSIAELTGLTADLAPDRSARDRRDLQDWLDEWRWWLAGVVVLVGTWGVQSAVAGELRGFWPGVPLGVWALLLIAVTVLPRDRD